jgi:hypothetical protein
MLIGANDKEQSDNAELNRLGSWVDEKCLVFLPQLITNSLMLRTRWDSEGDLNWSQRMKAKIEETNR